MEKKRGGRGGDDSSRLDVAAVLASGGAACALPASRGVSPGEASRSEVLE